MNEYVLYIAEWDGDVLCEPWWLVVKAGSAQLAVDKARDESQSEVFIQDVYQKVVEENWK